MSFRVTRVSACRFRLASEEKAEVQQQASQLQLQVSKLQQQLASSSTMLADRTESVSLSLVWHCIAVMQALVKLCACSCCGYQWIGGCGWALWAIASFYLKGLSSCIQHSNAIMSCKAAMMKSLSAPNELCEAPAHAQTCWHSNEPVTGSQHVTQLVSRLDWSAQSCLFIEYIACRRHSCSMRLTSSRRQCRI